MCQRRTFHVDSYAPVDARGNDVEPLDTSACVYCQVELTDIQKKYYRAILERNFSFLSLGANSNSNVPNLLNTMMELRKCCNHPYLINGMRAESQA